jgi:hypothetical protein
LRCPTRGPHERDHGGCNPIASQAAPQQERGSEKAGV